MQTIPWFPLTSYPFQAFIKLFYYFSEITDNENSYKNILLKPFGMTHEVVFLCLQEIYFSWPPLFPFDFFDKSIYVFLAHLEVFEFSSLPVGSFPFFRVQWLKRSIELLLFNIYRQGK